MYVCKPDPQPRLCPVETRRCTPVVDTTLYYSCRAIRGPAPSTFYPGPGGVVGSALKTSGNPVGNKPRVGSMVVSRHPQWDQGTLRFHFKQRSLLSPGSALGDGSRYPMATPRAFSGKRSRMRLLRVVGWVYALTIIVSAVYMLSCASLWSCRRWRLGGVVFVLSVLLVPLTAGVDIWLRSDLDRSRKWADAENNDRPWRLWRCV
jgi:hypothetical protein